MSDEVRREGVVLATLLEDGDAKKGAMREVVEASFLTGDTLVGLGRGCYWGLRRSNNSERKKKIHPDLSVCIPQSVSLPVAFHQVCS